uniref:Uncharacterized protein n=1 Tax=Pyramimonas obovata TaxID=1411642 RepID=A0A7S0MUU7_9CHLO
MLVRSIPLYEFWVELFPGCRSLLDQLTTNLRFWHNNPGVPPSVDVLLNPLAHSPLVPDLREVQGLEHAAVSKPSARSPLSSSVELTQQEVHQNNPADAVAAAVASTYPMGKLSPEHEKTRSLEPETFFNLMQKSIAAYQSRDDTALDPPPQLEPLHISVQRSKSTTVIPHKQRSMSSSTSINRMDGRIDTIREDPLAADLSDPLGDRKGVDDFVQIARARLASQHEVPSNGPAYNTV